MLLQKLMCLQIEQREHSKQLEHGLEKRYSSASTLLLDVNYNDNASAAALSISDSANDRLCMRTRTVDLMCAGVVQCCLKRSSYFRCRLARHMSISSMLYAHHSQAQHITIQPDQSQCALLQSVCCRYNLSPPLKTLQPLYQCGECAVKK